MTHMKQAFMADIIANPQDDTPRLIFADWLQDHGEEMRAEFIRLQIRQDREVWVCSCRGRQMHDSDCRLLQGWRIRERIVEILDADHPAYGVRNDVMWSEDLRRVVCMPNVILATEMNSNLMTFAPEESQVPEGYFGMRFVRGFVGELVIDIGDWFAHADNILAAAPVETVWLMRDRLGHQTITSSEWHDRDLFVNVHVRSRGQEFAVTASREILIREGHAAAVDAAVMDLVTSLWPMVNFGMAKRS